MALEVWLGLQRSPLWKMQVSQTTIVLNPPKETKTGFTPLRPSTLGLSQRNWQAHRKALKDLTTVRMLPCTSKKKPLNRQAVGTMGLKATWSADSKIKAKCPWAANTAETTENYPQKPLPLTMEGGRHRKLKTASNA